MNTQSDQTQELALFHYDGCPYCVKTRRAMKALGLDIELKNIQLQPKNRTELLQGGGKAQVPCLRIAKKNNKTQWLYESDDIINYLLKQQH